MKSGHAIMKKTRLFLGWSAVSILATMFPAAATAAPTAADSVYFGGDILTMAGDTPHYVEAVAVRDGRIAAVGTKAAMLKLQGPATRLVDLKGQTLMPGFIDPHLHPILGSLILNAKFASPFDWSFPWGDAKAVRGSEAFLAKVKAYAAEPGDPAAPLLVWGWLEPFHGPIDRRMLDAISTTRPIAVWAYSAHEMIFNTAALDFYGLTAAAAAGNSQIDYAKGRYLEAGFFTQAVPKVAPTMMSPTALAAGMARFAALTQRAGVTTLADMATGSSGDFAGDVTAMKANLEKPATPFRMLLVPDTNTLGLQFGDGDKLVSRVLALPAQNTPHLQFIHSIKLFADGAFFGQAMQIEPPGYRDGHSGEWIMQPDRLQAAMKLWWATGYDIHIHCNGSAGLTVILDALEALEAESPRGNRRIVIEHFGLSTAAQAARIARLGALVSANPYYFYSMADAFAAGNLGAERADELVRLGSLRANHVRFGLHSDFTMAPIDPLLLAWIAANRVTADGTVRGAGEQVPVYAALQGITSDAAYVLHMEDQIGSIAVGRKADFVILGQNPLKAPSMHLRDIKVIGTVFEGVAARMP
jgi:predicted amidohydrolase YtcJ